MIGLGLLKRLWPYIAIALLFGATMLMARRNGALNRELKYQMARAKMVKEMRDAGDQTPVGRAAVNERLRDGRF